MPLSNLTSRIASPADLSPAEVAHWEHLSATEPEMGSPFLSVHYAQAMAAAGMDARVCVVYRDGEIAAFLAFQFSSGWARRMGAAERIGGELCDCFGVVAPRGFTIAPPALLRLAKLNYLGFSHLEEPQIAMGLSGEQPRIALRVHLDPSAAVPMEKVASVTPHYLEESRARQRSLEAELGPVRFAFDAVSGRDALLDQLIADKRAQYRAAGAPDMLASPEKQRALHLLLASDHASCKGVLSSLYAGEHWLASHFGIIGHGMLILWFPVANPALERHAPDRLLLHSLVQASHEAGFTVLDCGEGDTPRKREIASEQYRLYRGVWRNGSATSHAAHAVQRLRWRFGM